MDAVQDLSIKADRAQNRSNRAAGVSGTAGLYAILSIPEHTSSAPKTPYDMTLGWAIDMVQTANDVISGFSENATLVGVVMGAGVAVISGLYSVSQRKKMRRFRQQAEAMSGLEEDWAAKDKGLIP